MVLCSAERTRKVRRLCASQHLPSILSPRYPDRRNNPTKLILRWDFLMSLLQHGQGYLLDNRHKSLLGEIQYEVGMIALSLKFQDPKQISQKKREHGVYPSQSNSGPGGERRVKWMRACLPTCVVTLCPGFVFTELLQCGWR